MRSTPIFDTNVFGHAQSGLISQSDWRFLLRQRPGRGWPLSAVTVLELLAGLHDVPAKTFIQRKEQIQLAYSLSTGRIIEEPHFLLCTEVLRVPFPSDLVPPAGDVLARYMDVVRRAKSLAEILEGRVAYKGGLTAGKGRAGFQTSVVNDLVAGPKKQWVEGVEVLATDIYPRWREFFQQTGKRLPPEMRKQLESPHTWEPERRRFVECMLKWLGATAKSESVAEITRKLDAVLEFTIFVAREFLMRNYSLEKHWSDVYDQFQLHYLAVDKFVIVSDDADLMKRTSHSSQADRIKSFHEFLQSF